MASASPLKPVKEFFGMDLAAMKREWLGSDPNYGGKKLTDADKEQIISGIANGTLTY